MIIYKIRDHRGIVAQPLTVIAMGVSSNYTPGNELFPFKQDKVNVEFLQSTRIFLFILLENDYVQIG